MSIASRITEIEQHIGNAYDKIEDLGIDITDVDKNINNISSMLENVWNEYPKVSVSDVEEASLDGTKKGRMNIDLKGNTEQEQLEGKNLLDYKTVEATPNTTVQLINNGFKVTGKYAGKVIITGLKANTDYYLQYIRQNIVGSNTTVSIFAGTSTSTKIKDIYASNTFNTGNNTTINIWFYAAMGGSDNESDFTFIQLEQGSISTDYEPYCGGIPSPNPDFPQTIHNVIGSNEFKIQNKNLAILRNDLTSYGASVDTTIIRNDNTGKVISTLIPIKPNTIYTLYREKSTPVSNTRCFYYDTSPVIDETISISGNYISTGANLVTKITTPPTAKWLFVRWTSDNDTNPCGNVQILEGSYTAETMPSYVLHQEQNYPFSLRSKNLLNSATAMRAYIDGNFEPKNSYTNVLFDYIKIKPNTTYILSTTPSARSAGYVLYDKNKNPINRYDTRSNYTFSNLDVDDYGFIRIWLNGDNQFITVDDLIERFKPQLEESTSPTSYEPYYDIKAMEGTTLQDDGIHNTRKHYIFTGQETLSKSGYTTATSFVCYMTLQDVKTNADEGKCNIGNVDNIYRIYSYSNGFFYNASGKAVFLKIQNSAIPNWDETLTDNEKVDLVKAFLAQRYANGTPVIVEYKLAEEDIIPYKGVQQEQYDAIKKAQSYDDQTNISQTNEDLPFILNIEALKK